MSPVPHAEIKAFKSFGKLRVEPKHVTRDLRACQHALDKVDGTRHGAEVHPLPGCALLDVADVALQCLREVNHCAGTIRPGQDPRVHNPG